MKSLSVGLGAFSMNEVEVVLAKGGAPSLVLHGAALACAADHGVDRFLVSLSHTGAMAQATVVAAQQRVNDIR